MSISMQPKSNIESSTKYNPPKKGNSKAYIRNLIQRLEKSWSAGVPLSEGDNFVSKKEVLFMIKKSIAILHDEPNVLELEIRCDLDVKLTLVGDTHGQFYDLLSLFSSNGLPSKTNLYLFNGDYVDRGPFSFQVSFLLLSLKAIYPKYIYLLRGNHESEQMNRSYGFLDEVVSKYDMEVLHAFWDAFRCLPLAAAVTQISTASVFKAFVVHGGIMPPEKYQTLLQLKRHDFNRLTNEEKKLVLDLLWSDPQKPCGRKKNRARGAGSRFGPDETKRFLDSLGFDLLVRSHQVKRNGFAFDHDNLCLTIFSCPNYCDRHHNKGAYLVFSKETSRPQIKQFSAVQHPPLTTRAFSSKL